MINSYRVDLEGEKNLTPHFKVKEFACKDGDNRIDIDDNLLEILESLRVFIHKPIKIVSGYRTLKYNEECGGAKNSYHCKGKAADIKVENIKLTTLAMYAAMMGARGIGIYEEQGFIHIDTRDDRLVFKEA